MTTAGGAERWDAEAERYDSAYDASGRGGRLVRARLQVALTLLGDEPGRVLDAGTGGGRLALELSRRGWTVTGLDASERMAELARRRLGEPGASIVVGRVEALPFADASFDAVAALGVLEYAGDVRAALAELHRVLRPGGTAVVSWPNFGGLYTGWRGGVVYPLVRLAKRVVPVGRPAPPPPPSRPSREQFKRLLEHAGFVLGDEVLLGAGGRPSTRLLAAQVVLGAGR